MRTSHFGRSVPFVGIFYLIAHLQYLNAFKRSHSHGNHASNNLVSSESRHETMLPPEEIEERMPVANPASKANLPDHQHAGPISDRNG